MNEISAPPEPEPAQVSQPAPRPREQPIGFSPQFGKIVGALAKAHAAMISPRKNKPVRIHSKRTNVTFTFRYTTLDVLNDMVREPLADNDLVPVHVTRFIGDREYVITTLLHPSEQWIETRSALYPEGDDFAQSRVSAISYAKRVNLACILDIAGTDDDDGNIAAGNPVSVHNPRDLPPKVAKTSEEKMAQIEDARTRLKFDRLMAACRMVLTLEGAPPHDAGVTVLQTWQAGLDAFQVLPDQPERADMWERIQNDVPAALRRCWGEQIPAVWLGYLLAKTPEQIAQARAAASTSAKEDVLRLKAASPRGYALLIEHIDAQKTRVGDVQAEAETDPVISEDPTPPNAPPPEKPQDAGAVPASEPAEKQPEATNWALLDAAGEISSTPAGPYPFAQAYAAAWLACPDADARTAIEEHNADGVAMAAERDRHAGVLLAELQSPGRSEVELEVVPPLSSAGQIVLVYYYKALQESLDTVRVNELAAWERVNSQHYGSIPQSPKLKVLQMIARRREALGL